MSLNANNQDGGGDFTPAPALAPGSYPARLVQVVDMGMQNSRPFKGQPKPPRNRIYLTYELSHEFLTDEDGNPDGTKPRWISEDMAFFNLEMTTAKSTERYKVFDPTGAADGDWTKLLGTACQVTLTKEQRKDGKGDTNYISHVGGAMTVPGYTQPGLVNTPRFFDLDAPDMEMFKELPNWLQDKLKTNLNYNGSALQAALGEQPVAESPVPSAAPAAPSPPAVPPAPAPAPVQPAPATGTPAPQPAPAPTPAAPAAPVAPPAPPAVPAVPVPPPVPDAS